MVVVFIGIIIGNAVNGRSLSLPSSFVEVITTPFQSFAAWIKGGFSGIGDYFENQTRLLKENELLRQQVAEANSRIADYEQTKLDNELYRQILGIMEQRPDFTMVGASVITAGSDENYNSFTVNKGSSSGISRGDAVVNEEGVVGIVSEVGLNYCKITTLLSPTTNIGGYDTGSGGYGVLTSNVQLAEQGQILLTYLPTDSTIAVGNVVITSGQGSNFPSGLVVGVVQRVTADAQGVSKDAVILPSADIRSLDNVLIITDFDSNYGATVYESAASSVTSDGEE